MANNSYPISSHSQLSAPATPLLPTYGLGPESILLLVEPYCRILAQDNYVPFINLLLSTLQGLVPRLPEEARPQVNALAQQILAGEAFHRLDQQDKLNQDFLRWLVELPDEIRKTLAADVTKNAVDIWNALFPRLQEALKEQLAPQIGMLQQLTGGQEVPWATLPPGLERLEMAQEVCRNRVDAQFSLERRDQWQWLSGWVDDLRWSWTTTEEVIKKERELFNPAQQHLLTRVLRTAYQAKCPSPSLPLSESFRLNVFLPLFTEALTAQAVLEATLRTRLDIVAILPQAGESFLPDRHDAPAAYRRPSKDEQEQPNTIYDVREVGIERLGKVLIKATVGIIEAKSVWARGELKPELPVVEDIVLTSELPARVLESSPGPSVDSPDDDNDLGAG